MVKKIKLLWAASIFVFLASILLQSCALQPFAWTPPLKPELKGKIAENELLSTTEWIGLDGWYGPEDIAVDEHGNLYCGAHVSETNFLMVGCLKLIHRVMFLFFATLVTG
jgi:hypothetical protein